MSKAIQGVAEIGAALGTGALMFAEAATGVGIAAIPFETHLMEALLLTGVATEAGAIASAIGSRDGIGVTTRTPASLRQCIRGVQRVGGTIVYSSTTGGEDDQYNLIIVIAGHPCWAIENVYLDGRQVFWDTSSSYNQTVNGYNFGGNSDGNNHTGPNGQQYNFGGAVFCAAFYGMQTSDPTVVSGSWVGPSTITGMAQTYPGYCSALYANDPTWAPADGLTPYLAGCTYVYLKLENNSTLFPNGLPEIRFTVHGKADIWDPRTSTRGWTSNWALQVADLILDPTWGIGDPNVNMDQLIAAANVCDESVACAAGDELQFTAHLNYTAGTSPGEILSRLCKSKEGRISHIGNEWFIWPPYWQGPSFTFDENLLLDAIKWEPRRPIADLCNRVTGVYTAPNYPYSTAGNLYDSNGFWNGSTANNFPFSWQPTDYPMYAQDVLHGYAQDEGLVADTPNLGAYNPALAYVAGNVVIYNGVPWQALESVPAGSNAPGTLDGDGNPYWGAAGNYLPYDMEQACTLSVSEAQRVAKIHYMRSRQQGSGTLTMSAAAIQMQPVDVMQFNSPTMGWSGKNLEIAGRSGQKFKFRYAVPPNAPEGGDQTPALFVEVPVCETDPSVYEWDDETEELTPYDVPAFGSAAGGI